jgi:steroid delta-isomerase-like uncharacterized protein
MPSEDAREQLRREVTPQLYQEVRELWKKHSIAEDRRDLDGLLSTLTEDCEYVLVQLGRVWKGREGARRFYTELLGAFPDVKFELENIVVGPQGVWEEARMAGTWTGEWLGTPASGKRFSSRVLIFFPWDPAARLFRGERMFVDDPQALAPGRPA